MFFSSQCHKVLAAFLRMKAFMYFLNKKEAFLYHSFAGIVLL